MVGKADPVAKVDPTSRQPAQEDKPIGAGRVDTSSRTGPSGLSMPRAAFHDPVQAAEDDLVQALADELIGRAEDGYSFDPAWDDPWAWAQGEIDGATIGYGPDIAQRVEIEALDRMIDVAQSRVDEHRDDEDW